MFVRSCSFLVLRVSCVVLRYYCSSIVLDESYLFFLFCVFSFSSFSSSIFRIVAPLLPLPVIMLLYFLLYLHLLL